MTYFSLYTKNTNILIKNSSGLVVTEQISETRKLTSFEMEDFTKTPRHRNTSSGEGGRNERNEYFKLSEIFFMDP